MFENQKNRMDWPRMENKGVINKLFNVSLNGKGLGSFLTKFGKQAKIRFP